MYNLDQHIISDEVTVKHALMIMDRQGLISNVLFVVDQEKKLVGSVTDGDIRRGLLNGYDLETGITSVMQRNYRSLLHDHFDIVDIEILRQQKIQFVPVVDTSRHIVEVIDIKKYRHLLPVDAVLMAGGKGQRLMPLTRDTPKPLLKVGDKPIIEYNLDRLCQFGINNIYISVNYLGEQICDYFKDGSERNLKIMYIREKEFMGTIASMRLTMDYQNDTLLLMNSDLLTNIDFYDFYQTFLKEGADMVIASTSYHVDIPYAVLEVKNNSQVSSLKEKPRYTYYSNAGIYIFKKEFLNLIPEGEFFNVTDLIDRLLELNKKVISFPIMGYWLDIGKHEDFVKAQEDIKHLNW